MTPRPLPSTPSRRSSRLVLLTMVVAAAVLSVLWWRADIGRCACEICPDEHCVYLEHIRDVLLAPGEASFARLGGFAQGFIHAQIPLGALLAAVPAMLLPSTVSLMLITALATWLCWLCVARIVRRAWQPDTLTMLLLAVAFWSNAVVVRGFTRPITDAVGMACTVLALLALERHLALRSRESAARLGALQILGLFARPSFIPMLGVPALAELVRPGPLRLRLRRWFAGAVLFGVLPLLAYGVVVKYLGIEHTLWMWQSAHQPKYIPPDRVRALLSSLLLAGGPYLLLGVFAVARPAWRGTTLYLHLAWIALYVSFLYLGGASLWPRYFAPIVPSVLVVAAPALDEIVRRRRTVATALVAAVATWHLLKIVRQLW